METVQHSMTLCRWQAQAHEPLRDVSASLNGAMDALRAELRRRIDAARPSTHLQVPRSSFTLLRSTPERYCEPVNGYCTSTGWSRGVRQGIRPFGNPVSSDQSGSLATTAWRGISEDCPFTCQKL